MGSGAVKTIVLLMGLVVLSFLVGSSVSDGLAASKGAFAVIAFVAVAFGALLIGKQSWKLLFFLPAFFYNAPIGSGTAGVSFVPLSLASAAAVLVYGILLWGMGYIRFRWRSLLVLDMSVVAILLIFVWSFIQYPVSMQVLDPDAEYVGGKEYIWLICAMMYYVALSSMSGTQEEMISVLKKSFFLFCLGQLIYIIFSTRMLLSRGVEEGQRYSYVNDLCCVLLFFIYCSAPIAKLILSPKRILGALVCFAGIFLGGRREVFVSVSEALFFASLMKRELTVMAVMGIFSYGSLFLLGEQHAWDNAPQAFQRVMAVLPGISVPDQIKNSTNGSSETRRMVWSLGMDPRAGYIKDYIWGDGFQTHTVAMRRAHIAILRKTVDTSEWGFARDLALNGVWHNGWLSTVHRIGLVGLALVNLLFIVGLVLLVKVSNAYCGFKEYPYLMALCLPLPQTALSYAWGTQTLVNFFMTFQALGIIKVLYCVAREQGHMPPLFTREQYVPLMIRDAEENTQQAGSLR